MLVPEQDISTSLRGSLTLLGFLMKLEARRLIPLHCIVMSQLADTREGCIIQCFIFPDTDMPYMLFYTCIFVTFWMYVFSRTIQHSEKMGKSIQVV
jgi:hypothetical protein